MISQRSWRCCENCSSGFCWIIRWIYSGSRVSSLTWVDHPAVIVVNVSWTFKLRNSNSGDPPNHRGTSDWWETNSNWWDTPPGIDMCRKIDSYTLLGCWFWFYQLIGHGSISSGRSNPVGLWWCSRNHPQWSVDSFPRNHFACSITCWCMISNSVWVANNFGRFYIWSTRQGMGACSYICRCWFHSCLRSSKQKSRRM